jgi:hypothetical protein
VATTPEGTRRSRDGGRSWEPLAAPALTILAWSDEALLWGVTATGRDCGPRGTSRASFSERPSLNGHHPPPRVLPPPRPRA